MVQDGCVKRWNKVSGSRGALPANELVANTDGGIADETLRGGCQERRIRGTDLLPIGAKVLWFHCVAPSP